LARSSRGAFSAAIWARIGLQKGSLVVVPDEAKVVRLIFELYPRTGSIVTVAQRLTERGLRQVKKRKGGQCVPGRAWDKNSVLRVLRNDLYLGKVRGKDGTLYQGEHEALVSQDVFDRIAARLDGKSTGTLRRSRRFEFLLTGLLRCGPCDAAMTSSSARGRNGKPYRYYRCVRQQNEGTRCPTGLVAVDEVESAVVGQLRDAAGLGELRQAVLTQLGKDRNDEVRAAVEETNRESAALGVEARRILQAIGEAPTSKLLPTRLADVEAQMDVLTARAQELRDQLAGADAARLQSAKVVQLLEAFDGIWEALIAEERRELLHTLIRCVSVDPERGGLRIAFHDMDHAHSGVTA
jgi:site-specific DNA recombinase